jgi:purine-nucleoside phosphorylase
VEGAKVVKEFFGREKFDVAVVGGSGIGFTGRELPYSEIPGMPLPKVPGHRGVLKFKQVGSKAVLFFEGRFHYYEGREDWEIRFIPQLAAALGVELFIPTCSSGAVSRKAARAEVGVITDHINLTGRNPLVGLIEEYGQSVFVNGKKIYDWEVGENFLRRGLELGIRLVPVVLAAVLGPNYETFAEVRMLEVLGADCVSMSTVPEAIAAAFYGMRVCGLTVFTNDATAAEASHDEVLEVAGRRSRKLAELIEETLLDLG